MLKNLVLIRLRSFLGGAKGKDGKPLPSAFLAFASILVPVILICAQSFGNMFLPKESGLIPILTFIGNPIFALFIGVVIALLIGSCPD